MGVSSVKFGNFSGIVAAYLGQQQAKPPPDVRYFDGVKFDPKTKRLKPDRKALDSLPSNTPNPNIFQRAAEAIANYFNDATVDHLQDKSKINYTTPAPPPKTGLGSENEPYRPSVKDYEPVLLEKELIADALGVDEKKLPNKPISFAGYNEFLDVIGKGDDEKFKKMLTDYGVIDPKVDEQKQALADPIKLMKLKNAINAGDSMNFYPIRNDRHIEGLDDGGDTPVVFIPEGSLNRRGLPDSFFPEVNDKGEGVKLVPNEHGNLFQKMFYIHPVNGRKGVAIKFQAEENTSDGKGLNQFAVPLEDRIAVFPTKYDVNPLTGRRSNPQHQSGTLVEKSKPEEVNE